MPRPYTPRKTKPTVNTPLRDPLTAFCAHSTARLQGVPGRLLSGLTFAAKDLFDIAGHVTGAGNPDWLALHLPASRTAPVVQALVDAGADMVGKTHTDELSRGILGENAQYGTPTHPKAPGRVPRGPCRRSSPRPRGGCPAAGPADRLRRWREAWSISRSGRIPAGPCASRQAFAGSSASAPAMDACRLQG